MNVARAYGPILLFAAVLAALPLFATSNTLINAMVTALIIALAGQGWNLLGGYGGQFSFGHAAFFGVGAYGTALLQMKLGVNAYAAFAAAAAMGALVGLAIGYLSFRSGLRGSYFALVTLAFAEVLRILANAAAFTGGAAGVLVKLDVRPENFQFASRAVYFWILLAIVVAVMLANRAIERSRFGAWLVAVRENEDAARALGVDTLAVKLKAITLSAAVTAMAGAFYAQYFLFIDASIAFGPWISVEALLGPIIGGLGTVFGPVIGALGLHALAELTKLAAGRIPGLTSRSMACCSWSWSPSPATASSGSCRAFGAAWCGGRHERGQPPRRRSGLEALRRSAGRRQRQHDGAGRAHHRPHRPERGWQDDAVRPHLGFRVAHERQDPVRGSRHRRATSAPAGRGRHRAHFPRSCSLSSDCRCARTSPSARICVTPAGRMRWRRPTKWPGWSVWRIAWTRPPPALPSLGANGWNSPAP